MPSKKQWGLIFFGTLVWSLFIHFYGSPHHTIKFKWQDNVSNICATELFSLVGLNIYKKPPQDLLTRVSIADVPPAFQPEIDPTAWFLHPLWGTKRPLFFAWPWVPRPYPVGAWLWYAPYSMLVYHFDVSLFWATMAQSFVFLLISHFCFFLFYNFLSNFFLEERLEKKYSFFKTSLIFLYLTIYLEFIWWSAEGQYDLIAMIPLFFSFQMYQQKKYTRAIFLFAVALNFHFRVLFALGLLLICGYQVIKKPKTDPESAFLLTNWKWHLPSALLGGFASLIFFWNSKYVTDTSLFRGNDYHYSLLFQRSSFDIAVFILAISTLFFWLSYKKYWEFLIAFILPLAMMLLSPQICGWYSMFLFPFFLMIPKNSVHKKSIYYTVFLFYIFAASTFMKESPFDLHFLRDVIETIQEKQI